MGTWTLLRYLIQTNSDAAKDIPPQEAIVNRIPISSVATPMSGEPKGVPPIKISKYNPMTRPRIAGSVLVCTSELADTKVVKAVTPQKGSQKIYVV